MAVAIGCAALPSTAPAAVEGPENATPGCITRSEYRRLSLYDTYGEATQVIGAAGRVVKRGVRENGVRYVDRTFKHCGNNGRAYFRFVGSQGHISIKSW